MTISISELRGITKGIAKKLKQNGITNSDNLVSACKTPAQRRKLCAQVGADDKSLLALANRADLARVKGIGGAYSNLLEKAGVDTVKELATRKPANLHAKILEINGKRSVVRQAPALTQVERWVAEAKGLPKALQY